MTSQTPTTAAFAELSPEQRQALFDKLRQRKLSQARQPADLLHPATAPRLLALTPAQAACLTRWTPQTRPRLLELVLEGPLPEAALRTALGQLGDRHPALRVRLSPEQKGFVPLDQPIPLHLEVLATDADSADWSTHQRQRLASGTGPGLQAAVALTPHGGRLLLSAHPLLLDADGLLRLAAQWLALAFGVLSPDAIPATDATALARFTHWSSHVLAQKSLELEWLRLKPRTGDEARLADASPQPPLHAALELSADFIQTHGNDGSSIKYWLCEALHRCLSDWLTQPDLLYWFSAPPLRDARFESLPGFFPYFVPVSRLNRDPAPLNQRLPRLYTRFAPVSEQLALSLCQTAGNAPLLHYHWFDAGLADDAPRIRELIHHPAGLLLSPVEIQITERLDGIRLDVHADARRVRLDRIQALLQDLHRQLQQTESTRETIRPGLHEHLRQIWKDLLQKSDIDNDQSFFELGGHSLQVTELKFRIRQQLKLDLPISVLYELATINKLASFIQATQGGPLGWNPATAQDEEEEGTL